MSNISTNSDDIIDSRDIIERIEELTADIEESGASVNLDTGDGMSADGDRDMTSEIEELATLLKLQEEAEDYSPDWKYGAQLIRDSCFREYAQDLAEDCGMINRDASWPNNCIDWNEATRQLKQDYSPVEFDGVTYWVR